MDSTDRAITRILDKQLSTASGSNLDLDAREAEEAKKENDQQLVNLRFDMDKRVSDPILQPQ